MPLIDNNIATKIQTLFLAYYDRPATADELLEWGQQYQTAQATHKLNKFYNQFGKAARQSGEWPFSFTRDKQDIALTTYRNLFAKTDPTDQFVQVQTGYHKVQTGEQEVPVRTQTYVDGTTEVITRTEPVYSYEATYKTVDKLTQDGGFRSSVLAPAAHLALTRIPALVGMEPQNRDDTAILDVKVQFANYVSERVNYSPEYFDQITALIDELNALAGPNQKLKDLELLGYIREDGIPSQATLYKWILTRAINEATDLLGTESVSDGTLPEGHILPDHFGSNYLRGGPGVDIISLISGDISNNPGGTAEGGNDVIDLTYVTQGADHDYIRNFKTGVGNDTDMVAIVTDARVDKDGVLQYVDRNTLQVVDNPYTNVTVTDPVTGKETTTKVLLPNVEAAYPVDAADAKIITYEEQPFPLTDSIALSAGADVHEFTFEAANNGADLDNSQDGSELLKAISRSGTVLSGIKLSTLGVNGDVNGDGLVTASDNMANFRDDGYLIAYQSGNAYMYHYNDINIDQSISASEIVLIGIFEKIALGSFSINSSQNGQISGNFIPVNDALSFLNGTA